MPITEKYVRRTAECEAVRVNLAEINAIAAWCNGTVGKTTVNAPGSGEFMDKLYISLRVTPSKHNNAGKRKNHAELGDWIIKDVDGFKVYTDNAFRATFLRKQKDIDAFAEVLKIVKLAMLEQDTTTYHQDGRDMTLIAKASTMLILEKTA